MMKKKIFAGILCLLFVCLCFSSCGFIGVPQIADVDEETAKSLLISRGLIPTVKYESSDTIAKGRAKRKSCQIASTTYIIVQIFTNANSKYLYLI